MTAHKPSRTKKIEDQIPWKRFDSKIVDIQGSVIFEMKDIEAPAFWSQTAVDITASKYFFNGSGAARERSVRQLVNRIAKGLETALIQSKIFKTRKEILQHIDRIKWGLYQQHFAFNSPVWFNCGLSESYKIKSAKSEHFALNLRSKKIQKIEDVYLRPQVSACFIQSVDDSMESIFNLLKSEAMLFKYGSGTGTNFTPLRSKYETLKSGGKSSGLISFLEIYDKSAGSIKSGGITRRAAKMVCLDVDHPEILDFIDWKKHEEGKAQALVKAGYNGSLDGEVYRTISGQNSNNSVRVTDQFMHAVRENNEWNLKYPSSQKIFRKIAATEIWSRLCQSAWECADPGIQFHDTINSYNTCKASDQIRASNPCSEFMFLDDTACNLASLNLARFYKDKKFDLKEFVSSVDLVFKTQEALVDYSSYPTELIAYNSFRYRPIGLGFANLGSLLMLMGLPYDSHEARAWAGTITAAMTAQSYLSSVQIAQKKSPFPEYKKNKRSVLAVIQKQFSAIKKIDWVHIPAEHKKAVFSLWKQLLTDVKKYGLRNSQVTVIAPTGTIGLLMDCGTTGIEPDYSLVKNKKFSGGGYLTITNPVVEQTLKNLSYKQQDIDQIMAHIAREGTVVNCSVLQKDHYKIFQTAQGKNAISAEGHLLMMAAVQPFLSGAISKTVNLAAEAQIQDVSNVYMKAWELGLKSVSLYRDQSKFIQPLSSLGSILDHQMKCIVCKNSMVLEGGCYKCHNCGFVSACVG